MEASITGINDYISRLSLPGKPCDSLSYCAATPEALKEYLESLPHSNAAELCNRLYHLLPEVAGLQIPPGRKIALLDLVKPEALQCVQRLTNNLAITAGNAKLLSLSIAMLKYLAEGYKSILVTVLKSPAAPPELVVDACHSILIVLRQILMDCWETYVPPPARTWLELHAVFAIARLSGVDQVAVQRRTLGQPQKNTLRSAYAIPLMLYGADPARYTPQDLRHIEYFLQASAHLVDFDRDSSNGIFVVDPHADRGPQYSFRSEHPGPEQFRLATYRLVRHLEESLATGTLSGLSERLARDLCQYWSREVPRKDVQEPDDTALTVVIGLSHIHRYVTATRNIADFLAKANITNSKFSVLELMQDDKPDHRDTFLEKKPPVNLLGGKRSRTPAETVNQMPATALRSYPAVRTNYSPNGARIEFEAPSETLTAGEVVLIQPIAGSCWQLGLVRWTQVTRKLTRMLGVEMLADAAIACAAAPAGTQDPQFFSGLVFETESGPRIVLPTLPFKPYSAVKLVTPETRKVAKLKEQVDATFHVSIFNLEMPVH